ncbi:Kunitz type trypsin inhibitor 104 [Linum grandiflorum]
MASSAKIVLYTMMIWLLMAISATAQPAILDTAGQPVRRGVDYYILPAITDVAGGLTLVPRNATSNCPLYVGQEPLAQVVSQGLPAMFAPFASGENIVRESRDLTVTFSAATTCIQGTTWVFGEEDAQTRRRLLRAGSGTPTYFRIDRNTTTNAYQFVYCPGESCTAPNCGRPRCGAAGILVRGRTRFLAFDGPAFPFRFVRV